MDNTLIIVKSHHVTRRSHGRYQIPRAKQMMVGQGHAGWLHDAPSAVNGAMSISMHKQMNTFCSHTTLSQRSKHRNPNAGVASPVVICVMHC
jgi:hypothetical protein